MKFKNMSVSEQYFYWSCVVANKIFHFLTKNKNIGKFSQEIPSLWPCYYYIRVYSQFDICLHFQDNEKKTPCLCQDTLFFLILSSKEIAEKSKTRFLGGNLSPKLPLLNRTPPPKNMYRALLKPKEICTNKNFRLSIGYSGWWKMFAN